MTDQSQVMKWIFVLVGAIALGVLCFYTLNSYIYEQKQAVAEVDYKDTEYVIAGNRILLTDGRSEVEEMTGSASKIITQYFGNELVVDLNKDGRNDVVFLLTQQSSGSGVFYYVVAALNTERGYVGSEALLLGDRIAPQTIEKGKGDIIVVNYADRLPDEPLTTAPSVGKSVWLLFDHEAMQFGVVEQNFEGEADPSRMSLLMKPWVWVSALYNDGREIRPRATDAFKLTFTTNETFGATTDCNSVGGSYTADKSTITFHEIHSTLMYCDGSQESEFVTLLTNSQSYHFTSKGELVLNLKFDSGSVVFR
jgi:heat shock protein HslJ